MRISHRLKIGLGFAVLAFAVLACGLPSSTPPTPTLPPPPTAEPTVAVKGSCPPINALAPKPSGLIESITMALDTQGEERNPVNPTNEFAPKDTFHAVVAIKDAPSGTVMKADWYAHDAGDSQYCNVSIDAYELTTDGTRNIDFSLSPDNGWPSGSYRIEVYVNGVLDTTTFFTVK